MTALYVPGTQEKDTSKVIMALQAVASTVTTNTTNIATLTALIAALGSSGVSNILTGDVALNNVANYFNGPTVTLPTTGTWVMLGFVTLLDTSGAAAFIARLANGATVYASSRNTSTGASNPTTIAIFAIIAGTAADVINLQCRDSGSINGVIAFNNSANSKDSALFGFRIA